VPTDTDILLLSDDLRALVDAAEERGSLLQSELNDVLEPLSLDLISLAILAFLKYLQAARRHGSLLAGSE
jgi:hypothetical protein